MNINTNTILEHYGEEYFIKGNPLISYLKRNKKNTVASYLLNDDKEFISYWKIESNQLYLTKIANSKYSLKDLVNEEEPILADWYNGILEFYIDNEAYNNCYTTIWLKIRKGNIIDRKVKKNFIENFTLDFGKYKGFKVSELIRGKIIEKPYITTDQYIEHILDFFTSKEVSKIEIPKIDLNEKDIELIKDIKQNGIRYLLAKDYIAVSSKGIIKRHQTDYRAIQFSKLLEKLFKSNFTITTMSNFGFENESVNKDTLLINGNLGYLMWAIKNKDDFAIVPEQLSKKFSLTRLYSFETKRLNKFIFEFKPSIVFGLEYKFSEEIVKLNKEKFYKLYNVKRLPGYNFYTPNLEEDDLMNEYGIFLDDEYFDKNTPKTIKNTDDYYYDDYFYDNDEYYNTDDWLKDAAGTDDPDTMNDVYWNLD